MRMMIKPNKHITNSRISGSARIVHKGRDSWEEGPTLIPHREPSSVTN